MIFSEMMSIKIYYMHLPPTPLIIDTIRDVSGRRKAKTYICVVKVGCGS